MSSIAMAQATRELLLHMLYEAAELEHNLLCTYLYAAFSLKDGEGEGLRAEEAAAVARWRRTILDVAIDEMSHLTAVWNITSAVGGAPRFGRTNFPLDPGLLPAGVSVKLAPFSEEAVQHFVFLERPEGSSEPDGAGYAQPAYARAAVGARLTPMGLDYATVGAFYKSLEGMLTRMAAEIGEGALYCGDPAFQLSPREVSLAAAKPVLCAKTAIAAFDAIIRQGEGAKEEEADSHFRKFGAIREEYAALRRANSDFVAAHPAATNPVLRRPPRPEGRVWIEDEAAAQIVDAANASYQLMLRFLAFAYAAPSPSLDKSIAVDLSIDLMKAMTLLGESAARRPAGPSNPHCNAGMSFTALRDTGALPRAAASRRFFTERLRQLADTAASLHKDPRTERAAALLNVLALRAAREFPRAEAEAVLADPVAAVTAAPSSTQTSPSQIVAGAEVVEGEALTLTFNPKLCIHSRFCVTGAPKVFLANVQGPWIKPDAMRAEELMAIARECPSGAILYRRKDGGEDEQKPPVNLISTREAGPYSFRGDLMLDGAPIGYRATLCRCGASKNKPFCDGSHHDAGFIASGEPPTGDRTAMAPVRDGPVEIAPQTDGPLSVRGNLEIISGTGRVVARLDAAKLCRCGQSNAKPFCDGSHVKAGFKSA